VFFFSYGCTVHLFMHSQDAILEAITAMPLVSVWVVSWLSCMCRMQRMSFSLGVLWILKRRGRPYSDTAQTNV